MDANSCGWSVISTTKAHFVCASHTQSLWCAETLKFTTAETIHFAIGLYNEWPECGQHMLKLLIEITVINNTIKTFNVWISLYIRYQEDVYILETGSMTSLSCDYNDIIHTSLLPDYIYLYTMLIIQ